MITKFYFNGPCLKPHPPADAQGETIPVWIDLLRPDEAEVAQIDHDYALNLPTLEKMREIELSSRLYEEGGAYYMTFTYIADALGDHPEATPFTLVLKDNTLFTMRYRDMRIVTHFMTKAESQGLAGRKSNASLMIMILENIIDLAADALEKGHSDLEEVNRRIFNGASNDKDYKQTLNRIARIGDSNSKMRESLASLNRMHIFLGRAFEETKVPKETVSKLHTLVADIHSLLDHAGFVATKISFLLDATLGLINIEQNAIIKIFSVAAVIFLPPTLIASIYGMNFKHMPELDWLGGYPWAVGLMILSGLLPYWYFKRKKWL